MASNADHSAARPTWLRVMGALMAVYCLVLLGVFVGWHAAGVGVLLSVSVDVAHG